MKKIVWVFLLPVLAAGLLIPEDGYRIPVAGAGLGDWNPRSFWHHPWGRSGTHKGIDIFAKEGAPVLAATSGVVLYTGFNNIGGQFVLVLGPKWRLYYYAHLQRIDTGVLRKVRIGDTIGAVGTTGNAQGKPPHLHFSVRSVLPLFWQYDSRQPQALNKIFYIDPGLLLKTSATHEQTHSDSR